MNKIKNYNEMLTTLNDVRQYLKIARADDCVEELDKVAKYLININLQPTEEEVLKEFEDLGYILRVNNDNTIILHIKEKNEVLRIYKKDRSYSKYFVCWNSKDKMPLNITFQEHQLLTKLFRAWGWFNE